MFLLHSTREFPSRDVHCFSTPLWFKKILTQNSFKTFIGREESRRVAASARVEKGCCQVNRHRAYIGLLKGRVFPEWRFFCMGIGQISIP